MGSSLDASLFLTLPPLGACGDSAECTLLNSAKETMQVSQQHGSGANWVVHAAPYPLPPCGLL